MKTSDLNFELQRLAVLTFHGCGAPDCHAPPAVKPDPAAKCHCRDTIASALARLAATVAMEGITK